MIEVVYVKVLYIELKTETNKKKNLNMMTMRRKCANGQRKGYINYRNTYENEYVLYEYYITHKHTHIMYMKYDSSNKRQCV